MFCVNCGARLPEGAKFCESCGAQIAASAVGQETGASQSPADAPAGQDLRPVSKTQGAYQQDQPQQPGYDRQQPSYGTRQAGGQSSPYGQAAQQQASPYAQQPGQQASPYAQQSPYGQSVQQQPSPYGQQTPYAQNAPAGSDKAKPKGKVPVVPIGIAAVIAVVAIALIVMFVVKPGSQPASSSSAGAASSASQQASSTAAAATQFVGDWKLGGMEAQGVSICGDVSTMLGFGATLSIASGGTGSLDIDDMHITFNWEQEGDDAIRISNLSGEDRADILDDSFKIAYKEDALSFEIKGAGQEGTLIFSKDGTIRWMREISTKDAKKISSVDALNGTTWDLTGVAMNGVSMYGSADTVGSFMPTSMKSTSVKFKKNGTASLMGEDVTWEITDKGNAVISDGTSKLVVKSLDDDIVIDMSEYAGTDMVMLLSRAAK